MTTAADLAQAGQVASSSTGPQPNQSVRNAQYEATTKRSYDPNLGAKNLYNLLYESLVNNPEGSLSLLNYLMMADISTSLKTRILRYFLGVDARMSFEDKMTDLGKTKDFNARQLLEKIRLLREKLRGGNPPPGAQGQAPQPAAPNGQPPLAIMPPSQPPAAAQPQQQQQPQDGSPMQTPTGFTPQPPSPMQQQEDQFNRFRPVSSLLSDSRTETPAASSTPGFMTGSETSLDAASRLNNLTSRPIKKALEELEAEMNGLLPRLSGRSSMPNLQPTPQMARDVPTEATASAQRQSAFTKYEPARPLRDLIDSRRLPVANTPIKRETRDSPLQTPGYYRSIKTEVEFDRGRHNAADTNVGRYDQQHHVDPREYADSGAYRGSKPIPNQSPVRSTSMNYLNDDLQHTRVKAVSPLTQLIKPEPRSRNITPLTSPSNYETYIKAQDASNIANPQPNRSKLPSLVSSVDDTQVKSHSTIAQGIASVLSNPAEKLQVRKPETRQPILNQFTRRRSYHDLDVSSSSEEEIMRSRGTTPVYRDATDEIVSALAELDRMAMSSPRGAQAQAGSSADFEAARAQSFTANHPPAPPPQSVDLAEIKSDDLLNAFRFVAQSSGTLPSDPRMLDSVNTWIWSLAFLDIMNERLDWRHFNLQNITILNFTRGLYEWCSQMAKVLTPMIDKTTVNIPAAEYLWDYLRSNFKAARKSMAEQNVFNNVWKRLQESLGGSIKLPLPYSDSIHDVLNGIERPPPYFLTQRSQIEHNPNLGKFGINLQQPKGDKMFLSTALNSGKKVISFLEEMIKQPNKLR